MNEINGLHEADRDNIGGKELLRLTNDYVFKRTFAEENLGALAEFIASVTGIDVEELEGIVIDDPNLYPESEGLKHGELDVRVHMKGGEIVNIEIQLRSEKAFRERIIYYNDRLFTSQLKKGKEYALLNKTASIIITDFILLKENNDHFNTFKWYNENNRTLLSDIQMIHTLELPKLPDADDGTRLWRWLKLMKARKENEMEALAKGIPEMGRVVATVRRMSADERERRLAEEAEKRWRDARGAIAYAWDEG
ncbi:MAG: Rpn family recombination-promoting nuclease/putative transposase, partial [Clostridiales Family XIII bacterium]|nr:Rpn family recombination-promoting nuclease/putative transposase [Clostridiales Family XIII bacterium]